MAKPAGSNAPALVWFRDDLRLSDHPALLAAIKTGRPVICLFVTTTGARAGARSAARNAGGCIIR